MAEVGQNPVAPPSHGRGWGRQHIFCAVIMAAESLPDRTLPIPNVPRFPGLSFKSLASAAFWRRTAVRRRFRREYSLQKGFDMGEGGRLYAGHRRRLCQLAGRLVMTMIDVFVSHSERSGRGRCRLFLLFGATWRAVTGSRDWVWRVLRGARVASGEAGRTWGLWPALRVFVLRRLFDNFIGRKRDVDGGVLAGLLCLRRHGCA